MVKFYLKLVKRCSEQLCIVFKCMCVFLIISCVNKTDGYNLCADYARELYFNTTRMILISSVQQGTNLCNRVKVMSRSRRGNGTSGEAALAKLSQGVVAGLTRLVEDNADTVAAMLQAGECNDLELVQVL